MFKKKKRKRKKRKKTLLQWLSNSKPDQVGWGEQSVLVTASLKFPFHSVMLWDALEHLTSWDLKVKPQWKFHLSSFLPVIIASQLTNYRSGVFLPQHTTGEATVLWQDAILLVAALAKCVLPFKVLQKYKIHWRRRSAHLRIQSKTTTKNLSFLFLMENFSCNTAWKQEKKKEGFWVRNVLGGAKFDIANFWQCDLFRWTYKLRTRLSLEVRGC